MLRKVIFDLKRAKVRSHKVAKWSKDHTSTLDVVGSISTPSKGRRKLHKYFIVKKSSREIEYEVFIKNCALIDAINQVKASNPIQKYKERSN